MREASKYQSSPYLDEVEDLQRSLKSSEKTNLDDHHPLTINSVNPSLLRQKDKDWLSKNAGFNFAKEPEVKKATPVKKASAKKAPAKKVAKKK